MSAKLFIHEIEVGVSEAPNQFFELQESTSELFRDFYAHGINALNIRKAQGLSERIADYVTKDKNHIEMLKCFKNYRPYALTHPFLTGLVSVMICKRMDWGSPRTIRFVALGALLQNIGMTELPYHIQTTHPQDMNAEDLKLYQTHPEAGIRLLERFTELPSAVIQIILQHHENHHRGFPLGLTGARVYPLAKIVCLSDQFITLLMEKDLIAVDGLREFVSQKDKIGAHDPEMIKGLIKSFTKDK